MPLNLLLKPFADWNFLSWLWVLIGLVSVIFFIYLYKLSTKEGIELSEIEAPVLKDFFGRKQLSLKIKNLGACPRGMNWRILLKNCEASPPE
jgi:hypothetical protein